MLTLIAQGIPVHRLRATVTTDSVGDEVVHWRTPQRDLIPGTDLQSVYTTSSTGQRTRVEGERRLLIRGTFDLTATDRIEAEGLTWRLDGDPTVVRALAAGTHTSVKLVRFETR